MHSTRFDALTRALSTPGSRRATLAILMGSTLGLRAPWASASSGTSNAKKKGKRKKKCKGGKKKCGKKCIRKSECCTDADCEGDESCCSGQCTAPVFCNEQAVCGCDEVCRSEVGESVCQAGGCPETDFCTNPVTYFCSSNDLCVCTTTTDGANACVDLSTSESGPCDSDDECTASLGRPAVCIPDGPFCGRGAPFCVAVCTDDAALRAAGRSSRSPLGKLKLAK